MSLPLIILGAGGHAKVLIDALLAQEMSIMGIADAALEKAGSTVLGIPVIGTDEAVWRYTPDEVCLVNGVGYIGTATPREILFEKFKKAGYRFANVIHPSAVIARDVILGEGVQIMAGAVVQIGCEIGSNTIVNTKASIDHDCKIGRHVHVAPGVTLSGGVHVGDGTHVGVGTTVVQRVNIGENCLIGAGSLVLRDVSDGIKAYGSPAKEVE